jgi:subtilisin family serine protease
LSFSGCAASTPHNALKNAIGLDESGESHGTAVYSLISSKNLECPGIAPQADIYIVKIFNKDSLKDPS